MASSHTLAVGGLADQGELLAFASALEAEPQISAIALVRADLTLGVFSVIAGSRGDLVRACRRVRGFDVDLHGEDLHWDVLEVTAKRAEPVRPGRPSPEPGAAPSPVTPSADPAPPEDVTLPRARRRLRGRAPGAPAPLRDAAPLRGAAPEPAPRPWIAALDEAIDDVLSPDAGAAADARPWPPPIQVDVVASLLTALPVERQQHTVIASPLRSFEQVNEFRNRLTALEGVISLKVGRFYRGSLRVVVEYADVVPLVLRLRDLQNFTPIALTEHNDRIELTLDA
jgi:hypothetical protein